MLPLVGPQASSVLAYAQDNTPLHQPEDTLDDKQRKVLKLLPLHSLISKDEKTNSSQNHKHRKQNQPTNRFSAATADASALVQLIHMIRNKKHICALPLLMAPPLETNPEDEPDAQRRRKRSRLERAASSIDLALQDLRLQACRARRFCAEVEALRVSWLPVRVETRDLRGSGRNSRTYAIRLGLPAIAPTALDDASQRSFVRATDLRNDEGAGELRLTCGTDGRLLAARQRCKAVLVRYKLTRVRIPLRCVDGLDDSMINDEAFGFPLEVHTSILETLFSRRSRCLFAALQKEAKAGFRQQNEDSTFQQLGKASVYTNVGLNGDVLHAADGSLLHEETQRLVLVCDQAAGQTLEIEISDIEGQPVGLNVESKLDRVSESNQLAGVSREPGIIQGSSLASAAPSNASEATLGAVDIGLAYHWSQVCGKHDGGKSLLQWSHAAVTMDSKQQFIREALGDVAHHWMEPSWDIRWSFHSFSCSPVATADITLKVDGSNEDDSAWTVSLSIVIHNGPFLIQPLGASVGSAPKHDGGRAALLSGICGEVATCEEAVSLVEMVASRLLLSRLRKHLESRMASAGKPVACALAMTPAELQLWRPNDESYRRVRIFLRSAWARRQGRLELEISRLPGCGCVASPPLYVDMGSGWSLLAFRVGRRVESLLD